MKRRVYLATTTGVILGGCLGMGDSDDDAEATDDADDTDHDDDEEETDDVSIAEDDDDTDHDDDDEAEDDDDEEDADDDESEEEEADGELEVFDDFEELDEWEVVAGSLSADEDRSESGSQSAHLEASEGEEQVRIVRELDEPEDVSGMTPGLTLSTEAAVSPLIQLFDDDGSRIDYYQEIQGPVPFVRPSFGIGDVVGGPDLSEVTEIQIALWVGEEYEGEFRIDDLHFVPTPEGSVMIQFDGGYESVHGRALPVTDEHDLPATVFVPTNRIREEDGHEGDRLTEAQLEELADAGWTIGSYGARGLDLTGMDGDELDEEIEESHEWLEEEGYDAGYFAHPSGRYDGDVIERVADTYDVAFAGRYPAQGSAAEPVLCSRVPGPDPDDAERMLEWTAEYGGTTAFTYYALDDSEKTDDTDGEDAEEAEEADDADDSRDDDSEEVDDSESSDDGESDDENAEDSTGAQERFEATMELIAEYEGEGIEVATPEEFEEASVL